MKKVLIVLAVVASIPVQAQGIFKCNGIYTDKPCPQGEIQVRENTIAGSAASTKRALQNMSGEVERSESRGVGGAAQMSAGDPFKTYKQYDRRGNERYNPNAGGPNDKFRDYKQYGPEPSRY